MRHPLSCGIVHVFFGGLKLNGWGLHLTRGENLTVEAVGALTEDVEAGTKVFLSVKYNAVPIVAREVDLCDQISNVGFSCPIKKGPFNVTKTAKIPRMVPQGSYVVAADVYTEGHKDVITCLEGTAFFF